MLTPGQHRHEDHHEGHPAKPDRWLVGLVAGAALMYLLGKALGLGKPRRRDSRSSPTR